MAEPKATLKLNLIYGLVVLVPTALIAWLVVEVVGVLSKLGKLLGLQSVWGVLVAVVLGVAVLAVVCCLIGAAVRTRIGAWSFDRLEARIFRQLPGYQLLKNLLTGFAEMRQAYPAALVRLHDGAEAFCMVMEELPGGRCTVFLPLAPMVSLGSIYVVESQRLTMLEANPLDVITCVSQWGVGAAQVLPGKEPGPPAAEPSQV
ncbi:MAG: hypothetical protein K9K66_05075 [Desulfarculaceae bacterium]|nr:hypothetical protein [Desulfarculaceae bacterium]MCF8072845.1 hypothetical protein [Desulfarculaceae bacterium]MCF8101013.1 hypothetical protein [Desulfarculaceae bacterium]MCF8115600.1 hypothetical protein [Desulfarculaceae bacterium]